MKKVGVAVTPRRNVHEWRKPTVFALAYLVGAGLALTSLVLVLLEINERLGILPTIVAALAFPLESTTAAARPRTTPGSPWAAAFHPRTGEGNVNY